MGYGGPIGTHQFSFEWYHLRPPTASLKIGGSQPQPKTAIAIISGTGEAIRTSNLARTFIGSIQIKAHEKFWRKGGVGVTGKIAVGVVRDSPKIFMAPIAYVGSIARSSFR